MSAQPPSLKRSISCAIPDPEPEAKQLKTAEEEEEQEKEEQEQEEQEVVDTPVKAPAGESPAPPAVVRKMTTLSASTEASDDAPAAAAVAAAAIAAAAPQHPSLEAVMRYNSLPLGRSSKLAVKLTASPPPVVAPPGGKLVWSVMALDCSASMGRRSYDKSRASMLAQWYGDLVDNGVPDIRLGLRVLRYGDSVHDDCFPHEAQRNAGAKEEDLRAFTVLDDESRPHFKRTLDFLDGNMAGTNIDMVLSLAVGQLAAAYRKAEELGEELPSAMTVICLTDGEANAGITSGTALREKLAASAGGLPIFTNFIGLGKQIDDRFMVNVTGKGKAGIFTAAVAPEALSSAFEEIFNFSLHAIGRFAVRVEDMDGERTEDFGVLLGKRSVLVSIRGPIIDACSDLEPRDVARITWLNDGIPVGAPCKVRCFFKGSDLEDEVEEVRDLVEVEAVESHISGLQTSAHSVRMASKSISSYESSQEVGGYGAAAKARVALLRAESQANEVELRKYAVADDGASSRLYSAKMSSQSAYTR